MKPLALDHVARLAGCRKDRLRGRLVEGGLRRPLVGSAIGGLTLKIVNTLLALFTSILLARLLGADAYGAYAFAIACVTLIEVPGQLGLPTLVVRLTAAYSATADWSRLCGLLRRAGQITGGGLVLLVGGLGATLLLAAGYYDAEAIETAVWALVLIPLVVLGALRAAALRGLHHVLLSQVPSMLVRPALFLLLLALTAFGLGWRLGPSTAMALQVTATGVAFLIGAWWLWQRIPDRLRTAAPTYETRQWVRSALPLTLIGGIGVINSQVDVLMLGLLRSSEDVGVYRVAVQAANLVGFAAAAVAAVIAPTLSRLHVKGAHHQLQRVMTHGARAAFFLFALPVALLLIGLGGPILGTAFGSAFAAGHLPMSILCLAHLVTVGTGAAGVLLSMTGHERDLAFGLGLAAAINVVVNAALIPTFGMPGAATATTLTQLLWNVALAVQVYRRLAIRPTAFVRL